MPQDSFSIQVQLARSLSEHQVMRDNWLPIMPLRSIWLFTFVVLLSIPLTPLWAQNGDGSVRSLLIERDREIKAVLAHMPLSDVEEASLRGIVNDLILFEKMGEAALGDYWTDLSTEQRSEFVETFGAIVREQSLADLDPYRAIMTVESVTVLGDSGHATTSAVYKDITTIVEYDLLRRDDAWWITDISLDGVSTTEGYARSFQTAIRKRGFDGLMQSLRKRLDRITR